MVEVVAQVVEGLAQLGLVNLDESLSGRGSFLDVLPSELPA